MTPKQEAALRQALEALKYIYEGANNQGPYTGISWRCASNKVEPVIAAIDEALAEPKEKYRYGTPLLDAMTGKTAQPVRCPICKAEDYPYPKCGHVTYVDPPANKDEDKPEPADAQLWIVVVAFIVLMLGLMTLRSCYDK